MNHTEELLERWEAIHEIENLMGRRAAMLLTIQDDTVFDTMWTRNEPCLGFNHGYYKGYEAVAGFFKALREYQLLRAKMAIQQNPELAGKTPEELLGVGALHGNNLTTPVIELAGDGKTAKGLWYVLDGEVDYGPTGYGAHHCLGRIGADFIREDGGWKIWHLVYAEDVRVPMGESWTDAPTEHPVVNQELAEYRMPEPNVPMEVHESWHRRRVFKPFPPVPAAYETFADTFSYGV